MKIGTVNRFPGPPVTASSDNRADAPRSSGDARAADQQAKLSPGSLQKLIDQISKDARIERRSLSFSINDQLGRTVVQVIDRDTDEVIRQIPSEEFVRFAETLEGFGDQPEPASGGAGGTGLLIQAKA